MELELQTSHIEIPASTRCISPTITFIDGLASELGIGGEKRDGLKAASKIALQQIVDTNVAEGSEAKIGVDVYESHGKFVVEFSNRGVPIYMDCKAPSSPFHDAAKNLESLLVSNRGREGQIFSMAIRLGEEAARREMERRELTDTEANVAEASFEVRPLRDGEEAELSRLFYFVYGYDYINDYVYYPEKLRDLRIQGKLVSIVAALPNGRLVGHVGLLKWGSNPVVFEPCLGVVDPRLKSRGLFGQLFEKTMETVTTIPMQYLFFDFVTNHDFSQRYVARYGPADLSLFIGCQSKQTQAKLAKLGIGEDPKEMDRYSLLLSVIPQVKYPFGQEISLPNNLGELLGFLLKPLNVTWKPASRFQLLPSKGGQFETSLQPAQNAVCFDLVKAGRDAVDRIIDEWHRLLRNGYQYGAVEVAVTEPGLGNLYDILAAHGFFVAGFVPYHHSGTLGLRFQSIGPTKVAFDEIRVHTPTAKRLLEIVRQNYERNYVL